MKNFLHLLRHEIRTLFLTPSTYLAGVLFLIIMGMLYLFILDSFNHAPQEDLPSTDFFRAFWLPAFFIVPLLTMKSLAEERRHGTLETLMTTPVSSFSVVLSKFLSAYLLYLIMWSLTLGFPIAVESIIPDLAMDRFLSDKASLLGGYTFVAVSGLLYVALGVFASSLTRSQLIAGVLCFTLLFFTIAGGRLLADIPFMDHSWFAWMNGPIDYLQTFDQLEDFSRGIIDTRPFFFYISSTLMLLGITSILVEAKA